MLLILIKDQPANYPISFTRFTSGSDWAFLAGKNACQIAGAGLRRNKTG